MRAELVARAQLGDREAVAIVAHGASARLYATARLILRHPDRAEDALQDALIEAWRDIRGLRDPDRLDAWLHRLLVRSCHHQLRRDRSRRLAEITVPELELGQTIDTAGAVADRDEIERAFRRLSDEQRTILALVYYADLALAAVAVALDIPLGTVKSRLNRATAALRAALAAEARAPQLVDGQLA